MKWRMPIQFRNRPLSPAVQNSKEQAARSRLQRVAACTPHATPTCDETYGPCVCPASGTRHMCSARHLSCLSLSGLAPSPTPPRIVDDTPVPRPPPRTMHHLLSPPLSVRSRPEAPLCADHHSYPAAVPCRRTRSPRPLPAPGRPSVRARLLGGGVRWKAGLEAGLRREQRGAGRGQLAVALEVLSLRLQTPQLPIEPEQLE